MVAMVVQTGERECDQQDMVVLLCFIGESSPQKQGLMEKYEKRLRTSGVGMKDSNLHSWDD